MNKRYLSMTTLLLFFYAIAIFTITSCTGKSSEQAKPQVYQKIFSSGKPVSFDRQVFTVTKVNPNYQPPQKDTYSAKVPAGKKWIVISIKIENNAKHTFTFHKENVFLEDSNKNIYRGTPMGGDLARPGFMPMGDWLQGNLLYEVPIESKGLTLYYQPKYLQKKNQIIAIEISK